MKFEFRSFTRFWDNWGTQKIWAVPRYAHTPFSPNFLIGFGSDGPLWMFLPNLKSVASPVPEIIAIGILGGGCEPTVLGKRRPLGVRVVPFERALMSSYRPSIATFPLSLCFRDVTVYVLQHITFPHPTSSLLKISPCFPGSRWMTFGLRSKACAFANCACN